MRPSETFPRDGKVMESIIKEAGVAEFEPGVLHQMLELSYRYVTELLLEAKVMSQHARKKTIDVEDVRLGCTMVRERNQTRPPARLLLSQLARSKNRTALPVPGVRHGVRLPPDRFCLTANNFRLRKKRKVKKGSVITTSPREPLNPPSNPPPPSPLEVTLTDSDSQEPPVFTIEYDIDESNSFDLSNYFGL